MEKYLIINSDGHMSRYIANHADTIKEAREFIRKVFENPDNYHPRGIYKLIETHICGVKRDIMVIPEPEDSPVIEEKGEETITLLELVNKDMPEVKAMRHGCPCDDKFSHIFKKYGYEQPPKAEDENRCPVPLIWCDECWSRVAKKKKKKKI